MKEERVPDYQWLVDNAGPYAGQWVALFDGVLIAMADTLKDLRAEIKGARPTVVHHVEMNMRCNPVHEYQPVAVQQCEEKTKILARCQCGAFASTDVAGHWTLSEVQGQPKNEMPMSSAEDKHV